tara:strand:+ start:203 stop:1324 length:1122 start_codon:yes stop_codon:yes gene_type:complete
MSVSKVQTKMARLGDYIEEVALRLGSNTSIDISGINLEKGFIPTIANMNGINKSKYKLVPKGCFACNLMHIGRDVKIPIAYNQSNEAIAVSPAYYVFKIKDDKKVKVLGYYLEILFTREEFGRLTWFYTDSSIRGNLLTSVFNDIKIPLPDIDMQQELVDAKKGLKILAEQNEALIEPLTQACQAYIVDCKKKYTEVKLGEYIEECSKKNRDLKFVSQDARGVYSNGTFGDTRANLAGSNLASYKVVGTGEFAYSNRINIGSIAQNNEEDVIVSPSYTVFKLTSNKLISKYLFMQFRRKEFFRSTLFFAIGTIKDDFSYQRMAEVKIALPPLDVQQAIVNLYNCIEEAKKIANEAREKIKTLCPALVQKAINE